jgi:hypothetical protein
MNLLVSEHRAVIPASKARQESFWKASERFSISRNDRLFAMLRLIKPHGIFWK